MSSCAGHPYPPFPAAPPAPAALALAPPFLAPGLATTLATTLRPPPPPRGVERDGAPAPRGVMVTPEERVRPPPQRHPRLNLPRAAVELDAVVGLDGLDGVAPFREYDLGGALRRGRVRRGER